MITVRGKAKINWKPNYTLTIESSGGLTVDAGGTTILTATLTNTATGNPVPNRKITLTTDPSPRTGDGARKTTNADGVVTFEVSNVQVESVQYIASLVPNPPTTEPTVTADLTIAWGGVVCSTCYTDIQSSPAERFGVDPIGGYGWSVTFTVRTTSGEGCGVITDVTHAEGLYYVFPDGIGLEPDFSGYDVDDVEVVYLDEPETDEVIDAELIAMDVIREARVAELEAEAC